MTPVPLWPFAIVLAVSAPWLVQGVATMVETRARRRTESSFSHGGAPRSRDASAEDVPPFRARK